MKIKLPKKKSEKDNLSVTRFARRAKKKEASKIDPEREILLTLTPRKMEEEKKKVQKKTTKSGKVSSKKQVKKKSNPTAKKKKAVKKKNVTKKTSTETKKKMLKWTSIATLCVIAIIIFMMSSVFNVRSIEVSGNNRLCSEYIAKISPFVVDRNMFRWSTWWAARDIRAEAYVESVQIRRTLGGTIYIEIIEKVPVYMLYVDGKYGYIDNQGFILEITEELLEGPVIKGFETPISDIQIGNRLVEADLIKLGIVNRIMTVATVELHEIGHLITSIDISNDQNFILELRDEGITVHFGDSSRIPHKIALIAACIEQEEGVYGEFFLTDINRPFFRERVIF
ncbi:MAG: FtsQ-type POTRA domain-containing protein [Oscillospiraceae bacterium]|nr:FtsQ-type POTRA domain-containing protein [Oscillospiraceae bacterium]